MQPEQFRKNEAVVFSVVLSLPLSQKFMCEQ